MPRPEYRSITVSAKVYDYLFKEYEKEKDALAAKDGVRSFSGYISFRMNQIVKMLEDSEDLTMLNHDANGVKIQDNKLHRVADVQITPMGIFCPLCEAYYCEHVRFALSQPDVRDIVRKKRKEGWKLPDV